MHVIEVAPLIKGVGVNSLSYYSAADYPIGALLTIPVRNKEIRGVVLKCTELSVAKTAIRAATFSLRKLPPQPQIVRVSESLLATAKELSKTTPATFGSILLSLLPAEIRTGDIPVTTYDDPITSQEFSVSVLTAVREDRWMTYKRRIRESFAQKGSVVFVVPTFEAVSQVYTELTTGIEDRTIVLGPIPKKALQNAYKQLSDISETKLIITTASRSLIDRPDITDVIIDDSSSRYFKARTRPYLDFKEANLILAKLTNRRVLLGDVVTRSEDEYLRRIDVYQTEGEETHRLNIESQLRVIEQKDKPTTEEPFELINKQVLSAMKMAIKNNKRVFVYAARRGLSPVVACGDCGYIFRCPDSGTPYSLLRTVTNAEEKRWFMSSTSGRRVRAADTCPDCGSWRLRERGIGIQYIYDELKKHFPEEQLFMVDSISTPTVNRVRKTVTAFYEAKGSILLGTSMVLHYLDSPISMSVIPSYDAVRSVPTWRVDEVTFSLLLKLREITTDKLFVQTRSTSDELLNLAANGAVEKFYDSEILLRESLKYPPFSFMVHLTMSGRIDEVKQIEALIRPELEILGFGFYSSPDSVPGKTTRYGLCRVPASKWPNKVLMEVLTALPPAVKIEINPDRIV